MAELQKISFSIKSKNVRSNRTNDSESISSTSTQDIDFIHSLEDQQIKSTAPQPNKQTDYIVPLIRKNNWRLSKTEDQVGSSKPESPKEGGKSSETKQLEQEAASAILKDLQESKERKEEGGEYLVPLLLQNKPPTLAGREDDELADLELRPESSTLEEYEELPITKFGEAMLKGMGWKKGEAIGKTNKGLVEPIELMPRAQGRGLGAEEKLLAMAGKKKKPGDEPAKRRGVFKDKDGRVRYYKGLDEVIPQQAPEGFAEGNCATVLSGRHQGLFGKIVEVNPVEKRVTLRLGLNQQELSFSQECLQLVSHEEYSKNRRKPASVKESNCREPKVSDVRPPAKRRPESSEAQSSASSGSSSAKRTSKSCAAKERGDVKPSPAPWLFPNLRVRIIDQMLKDGRYYNQKVDIVDVVTPKLCVCKLDDGQLLENIHYSKLETVIPKQLKSMVKVVAGKHRGKIATLLEKVRSEQKALLDFGSGNIEHLHYDDLCEYSAVD